jgi:uncharacterized protein (DUF1330 family)
MANAYIVGHVTVKDSEKWQEYRSKVPATLEPWGGELLFRGNLSLVLSGDHAHSSAVAIRFPDLQSLTDWYSSEKYQSLIPLRQKAAEMDLLAYEE